MPHTIHPAAVVDRDGFAVHGRTLADLRGIRFAEGEGGNTPPADDGQPPAQDAGQQPPAPKPSAPPAPKPAPPAPQQPQQPQQQPQPRYDQEYVTGLREEAKGWRQQYQDARQSNDTLNGENTELKTVNAKLKLTNTILLNAPAAGGNAALLADSKSFENSFAEVNLDDPKAVTAHITEWLEQNPAFKATPRVPTASGGDGARGATTHTPTTLDGAVKKSLGG